MAHDYNRRTAGLSDAEWDDILKANPVLSDPKFKNKVKRWNKLYEIATEKKMNPQEAQEFIARGMQGI